MSSPARETLAPSSPRDGAFEHGRRALRTLGRAHDFEALELEGELPAELAGTLYRCGPAAFESYGDRYGHWFDGDGAITATRVAGGRAEGAVRFVDTEDHARERAAGRRLFPNFGTRPPSLISHLRSLVQGRIKYVANTNVLPWQGRLLALHEGSLPVEIEVDSLATVGPTDLGGALGPCMSAHPHRVEARACSYNIAVVFGAKPRLELIALPDAGPARKLGRVELRFPTMIHDFIATERHLLVLVSPLRLRALHMALRMDCYVDSLAWEPERGTEILAIPIDDPSAVKRFRVDPFFQFHFADAFERPDDGGSELVVDLVSYPDFPSINRWLSELTRPEPMREAIDGTLERVRIDLGREQIRREVVLPSCEFPRVAPAVEGSAHRYVYLAGHAQRSGVRPGLQDHLAKVDMDTGHSWVWDFGPESYPAEPVFVPDPSRAGSEDGGWLATLVYDGVRDRSCFALVDAQAPERGVLARAWFDQHIPPAFHGNWSPAAPR